MTKVIWKYTIADKDRQMIEMPAGAEVLTLQAQGEVATIWVLCDPSSDMVPRFFRVYGTGHKIGHPESLKYVGTYQTGKYALDLVFHVFEEVG